MRAAWLEVDLAAYRRNLRALAAHAGRPVLAVVKANGYGHGIELVARAALEAGCPGVAVALPEEGLALRQAGQGGRIVVLGLGLQEHAGLIAAHRLEPVVSRWEMLAPLAEAGKRHRHPVWVHVKVDTGMSRVGIDPKDVEEFCRAVDRHEGLRLTGVLTHFASADEEDGVSAREQWERFRPVVELIRREWPYVLLHAANSAAATWFPQSALDLVRGGIVTYGVPPAPRPLPFPVEPVGALRARVVQVKEIPAGRSVSYGGTWTASRTTRLALIPLGYADGYPWALSNRGEALLRGRRVPVRGRVCMDQLVLDVTELGEVAPGEIATFVGRDGEAEITVQEVADRAGSMPYEIVTRWSTRLPRVPLEVGEPDAGRIGSPAPGEAP